MMLDIICDDMAFSEPGKPMRGALDRPVVALGAAGGEENLCRYCLNAVGKCAACGRDGVVCAASELIERGCIAVFLTQIRQHRLERRV